MHWLFADILRANDTQTDDLQLQKAYFQISLEIL